MAFGITTVQEVVPSNNPKGYEIVNVSYFATDSPESADNFEKIGGAKPIGTKIPMWVFRK